MKSLNRITAAEHTLRILVAVLKPGYYYVNYLILISF